MKTQQNDFNTANHKSVLITRVLIGAGIGLVLITLFLSGVNNPKPEWGEYWKIRPMLMLPFAGAVGGLCFHILDYFRVQFSWNRFLIYFISLLIFVFGLWMGTVLGLVGTLWN